MRHGVPTTLFAGIALIAGCSAALAQTQTDPKKQPQAQPAKPAAQPARPAAQPAIRAAQPQQQTSRPAARPSVPPAARAPAPRQQATTQRPPSAARQLNYANQGQRQADHVFDGRAKPANPVRAQPGNKPSVAGVPASQFRPNPVPRSGSDVSRMRTNPPPSPVTSRAASPAKAQTPPKKTDQK